MDRIWLDAPLPALFVRAVGGTATVQGNAAARSWAREAGVLDEALHIAVRTEAARLWAMPPTSGAMPTVPIQLGARLVQACPVRLDAGLLLWLQTPTAADADALQQARRATEFLDRALVLAGVSVWRIDLRTRRIHFNAVGFQAQGRPEDPAGLNLDSTRNLIHPDDRAAVDRAVDDAIAEDRVVDAVARYRNPDGSWRTLLTRRVAERDADGEATGIAGVSLDLSRHLADRERSQALAEQASLVAEALGVGFWSRSLIDRTAYWDAQMFRLHARPRELGAPQDEQWVQACVHPQDQARMLERTRQAQSDRTPLLESLFRAHDNGGRQRWMQAWTCYGQRGGQAMLYGMHLDVTERKAADDLRAEKQRLEQESREKSAFMARMSHELRTPMNAVLGFTQLLEGDAESPPSGRQRQRLGHIAAAGQQLMTLIDGLLEIAQRELPAARAEPAVGLHVLCVEDNPVNLQLVRELLALRPQVRLRTAVDGLSGVDAALAEAPDLLLLDLQLPDIDGLEVMRRVRADARLNACRIIALSADAMPDHIEAALAAGFDDYWTKPIQFDNFLSQIDRLAAERTGGDWARAPAAPV